MDQVRRVRAPEVCASALWGCLRAAGAAAPPGAGSGGVACRVLRQEDVKGLGGIGPAQLLAGFPVPQKP